MAEGLYIVREHIDGEDDATGLGSSADLIARLKAGVRARDDFVAIAAHELRNPMTSILGQIELLQMHARKQPDECPPRISSGLEMLHAEVLDFIGRATVLLDTTRIVSGMLRLEPAWTNMSSLIEDAVARHQGRAKKMGSTITADIASDLYGCWDAMAVNQIADNLLSNAVRYGGSSAIHVSLADQGESAKVTVRDHGPGMHSSDLERIFARFEQAVSLRDRGGFGIGLWVVRQLTDAMQGQIRVDSETGKGTAFIVELPKQASHIQERP